MNNFFLSTALRGACSALAPSRILTSRSLISPLSAPTKMLLAPKQVLSVLPDRSAGTFFGHKNAQELWKAVTSVSNQGRQRGRAKGLVKIKNLHKGQKLGFGPSRVSFPGKTQFSCSYRYSGDLTLDHLKSRLFEGLVSNGPVFK